MSTEQKLWQIKDLRALGHVSLILFVFLGAQASAAIAGEPQVVTPASSEAANPMEFARITQVLGPKVLVSRGEGYKEEGRVGTSLAVGDRILIGQGSGVTLFYPSDSCTKVVSLPTVFSISRPAPCQRAAVVLPTEAAAAVGAITIGGALAALAASGSSDQNQCVSPPCN